MANINIVIMAGNLTQAPEVRYTPQGTAVAQFRLAVNRTFRTKEGQQKEEVCFVDVETWGRQAETCGEYLKKGRSVLVEGRLVLDTWENKEGQKRSKHKVRANRVQFLGSAPSAGAEDGEAPSPSAPFEEDFTPSSDFAPPAKGEDEIPF